MISGKSVLLGVMGWPVAHSLSPRLHNYWLEQAGIDAVYVPLPVEPETLAAVIKALPHMGFRGVNLTIPHKETVLALADEVDPVAARMGAANTLVARAGALWATNTDAYGFAASVQAAGRDLAGPALVLGAGGAAQAVLAALQDAGCAKIYLANRSAARAQALAARFGGAIEVVEWQGWERCLPQVNLLVNSTRCGLNGKEDFETDLGALPVGAAVCDLVYKPLMTGLLRQAAAAGRQPIDGLGMLLYQAQASFGHWFGVKPPVDEALRRFVLDGMA